MNKIPVFSIVDILVLLCTICTFFFINILVLVWFSMQRTSKEFLVRTKVGRGETSLQKQYR